LKQATLSLICTVLMSNEEKGKLDEIFQAIDRDNDGKLSRQDLRYGFQEFFGHDHMSENELRKLFWQVGRHPEDVSEHVEYSEFLIGAADKTDMLGSESLQQAFTLLDKDNNGFISAQDLKQVLPSCDDTVNQIISRVDIDGDGMISFGEFLSMVFKSAKVQSQSKEKEWMKVVKDSNDSSNQLAFEPTQREEREWKYKSAPNRPSFTAEEFLSPDKKIAKGLVSELKGRIPHMKGLVSEDNDGNGEVPDMAEESGGSKSDHDRDMNPIHLPSNVMSQLKAAQTDLKGALHHVTKDELFDHKYKNYKEVEIPFLNELKVAQEDLESYLKEVPDELKERPLIADRPYITELKKAQDTVLKDWRDEIYKFWI